MLTKKRITSEKYSLKKLGQRNFEAKNIYDKAIRWAELCYRVINLLFLKIFVVAFMLPLYIACIFAYYFANIPPEDSLVLPYYMWYVSLRS